MNRCTNAFLVSAVLFVVLYQRMTVVDAVGSNQTSFPYNLNDLGVKHVRVYTWAPVNGTRKPLLLKLWLKRILRLPGPEEPASAGRIPFFLLPSQQSNLVEGFGWAEDLASFKEARHGKLRTPVDILQWEPHLVMELSDGSKIRAQYSWKDKDNTHAIERRPFFFYFDLPRSNVSSCFKIIDQSVPDIKMPMCLPIVTASLCHRLAPPDRFTPAKPALWTAMIPFRSINIPGPQWDEHMVSSANRIRNYIAHLRRIGGTGVLLYTNQFTAQGMAPHIQDLLMEGSLVFVSWEQTERPKYHYDQALIYAHALLGLASCGNNLWLQASDLDEYLYDKEQGRLWPDMLTCLKTTAQDEYQAAVFTLIRFDVDASDLGEGKEAALWSSAPTEGAKHPLDRYDKIAIRPRPSEQGKPLICPAYRIVGVWVHFVAPVHGHHHIADPHCAMLLHVAKYWASREGHMSRHTFVDFGPSMYDPSQRIVNATQT